MIFYISLIVDKSHEKTKTMDCIVLSVYPEPHISMSHVVPLNINVIINTDTVVNFQSVPQFTVLLLL